MVIWHQLAVLKQPEEWYGKFTRACTVSPGSIGGQSVSSVSVSSLHSFLGVGRDFTTWIKGRINQYGFLAALITSLLKIRAPLFRGAQKIANRLSMTT
jgi:hypothetical protein